MRLSQLTRERSRLQLYNSGEAVLVKLSLSFSVSIIQPCAILAVMMLICTDHERFASRGTPNNLNVVTHSTALDDVERGGKVELRKQV